jgi:hypothetical protein
MNRLTNRLTASALAGMLIAAPSAFAALTRSSTRQSASGSLQRFRLGPGINCVRRGDEISAPAGGGRSSSTN